MNTNDFASLLWILKMSRQNGVVHVELPKAERTEMGEMWRAHLHLVEGHVAACHVLNLVDGRLSHCTRPHLVPRQRTPYLRRDTLRLHNGFRNRRTCRPLRDMVPPPAPCRAAGRPFTVSQAEHTSTTDRASRTERDQFLASEAQADLRLSRRKEKRQAYCNYIEAFPRGC